MPTPQVLEYIRRSLEAGHNPSNIKRSLLAVGWKDAEVDAAIRQVQAALQRPAPSQPPSKASPFLSSPQTPFRASPHIANVPSSPQPASFSEQGRLSSPHRSRKAVLLPIIFLVMLLAGGTAASAFYYGVTFSLPFLKPSPEFVLREAIVNYVNAQSFEYEGWVQVSGEDTVQELSGSLRLHYNGGFEFVDKNDPASAKGFLSFDAAAEAKDLFNELSFTMDIRVVDKVVYVRITDLPVLPFGDFSAYENQWVHFEPEKVSDFAGGKRFEESMFDEAGSSADTDLTEEQWQQLKELIARSSFFTILDKPTDELLEGRKVHHYHIFLDGPGLIAFYREAYDILQPPDMTREELEAVIREAETNEVWQQILTTPLEIWVDKKMLVPVKLSFTTDLKEENKGSLTVSYELFLRNFNEPVTVVAPGNSRSLEEVVEEVMSQAMDGIPLSTVAEPTSPFTSDLAELQRETRDSQRFSDLSAIQSSIALYLITVSDIDLDGPYQSGTCADEPNRTIYYSLPSNVAVAPPSGWQVKQVANANLTKVNGSGWMPIDLAQTTGGSPLDPLPTDPTNTNNFFYTYVCRRQSNAFEMSMNLESKKFITKEASDGGDDVEVYETGTAPGLRIAPKGTHTSTPGE